MDMNQYLDVFLEESKEHLQTCNNHLLSLEKEPENSAYINEIFRAAHTLKGMSATMGFEDMANLTHEMENILDEIRTGKLSVTSELIDVIFLAMDQLENIVQSIETGGDGKRDVNETIKRLTSLKLPKQHFAAEKEVAATSSVETANLKSNYDEFEITVIEQSQEQGYHAYEITINLQQHVLLKSARVFMVFNVLEKLGDIIKSTPSVEQLEEEQFDYEFTVTILTHEEADVIKKNIAKVSEIESIEILSITTSEMKKQSTNVIPEEEVRENKKEKLGKKQQADADKQTSNVNKTIRVNIERLDILMNLFEELVIDRGRLEQISKELNHPELQDTVEKMARVSSDLQNIILNMRMIPVETVFNRFPKMVRQLARDLHKKINLEIIGQDTELDRTVIDEIGDPLVHLLRNSIDHGIEMPDARLRKGKSEEGTIVLKAYHGGNHVFIEINDDGNGINREKVIEKAVSKEIITEEQSSRLTDKEIYELIFSSGFSTAEKVSDLSGRGVGLDVVKSTIESLGGGITVHSEEGKGTQFLIQLPLTLTIISVMLVEVQKEKYAIPLSSIIETAIIKKDAIYYAHEQPVIDFRGKVVPLLSLQNIFHVPVEIEDDEYLSIVIVRKGEKLAGLIVDSFIGQQEVVLKSLGAYLSNAFAISGATILGNGHVALIIDCNALIK